MRKYLSILMLACLLCGMVLSAGAEGDSQLYAQVGEGTDYQTSLTFEAGQTLTARFYTDSAEGGTPVAALDAAAGLTTSGPDADGYFTLSADTAGEYMLSHTLDGTTYSLTVTVTKPAVNTITIPEGTDLNALLSNQAAFETFIADRNYSGSGDLTLVLPAGTLGNVTCGVQLENGAGLILKGAEGTTKTEIKEMVISAPRIHLSDISFKRNTSDSSNDVSIKAETSAGLAVSNCTFSGSGYDFQLKQDAQGSAAVISLTGNIFLGNKLKAALMAPGKVLGYWTVTTAAEPETVNLDLNAHVEEKTDIYEIKYLEIQIDQDIHGLVSKDWEFKFKTRCAYSKPYAAYNKKQLVGDEKFNILSGYASVLVEDSGQYVVVNNTAPSISKGIVRISKSQALHLKQVTVVSPYNAVSVTFGKKAINSQMASVGNTRYLTFPVDSYGDYTIKETTKTVTKNTNSSPTSRKYTTSTQDYYLVTPAGFSNAVRYVKDNLATLNCTQAGRKPISLPVASMAAAAEKGYSVLVKTKNYEMTLDAAALKSLAQQAKGTTVLLHYKSLNHKTLTTVGQASVESHLAQYPSHSADLAFLVTATSESETIEDLQQGAITLKIPFIILPGTEGLDNKVYALQGESVSEDRDTTVADGYLTTKLLDLTEHMVFQVGEPVETTAETTEPTVETTMETTEETIEETTGETFEPETEFENFEEPEDWEEEEEDSSGLLLGVVIVLCVVVAVIGGVIAIALLRKRKQK